MIYLCAANKGLPVLTDNKADFDLLQQSHRVGVSSSSDRGLPALTIPLWSVSGVVDFLPTIAQGTQRYRIEDDYS